MKNFIIFNKINTNFKKRNLDIIYLDYFLNIGGKTPLGIGQMYGLIETCKLKASLASINLFGSLIKALAVEAITFAACIIPLCAAEDFP